MLTDKDHINKLHWLYKTTILTQYFNENIADSVFSSVPEVFFKKGVLKNFAKFTGKHLRPATFLKRDSDTDVFL